MDLTKDVLIFSGEGTEGTWERYFGARTEKALRSKLSRERCHGDRWAQAWVLADRYSDGTGWPVYQRFDGDGMRSVNPEMVKEKPAAMLRAGKVNHASAENGKLGGRPRKAK